MIEKSETKSAYPASIGQSFEELMVAFEAFKDTNDERLSAIEAKSSADVVTTDKLERINRTIDELVLKKLESKEGEAKANDMWKGLEKFKDGKKDISKEN